MVNIDHRYAFCRAKQDASILTVQTYKEIFDVKNRKGTMYGYMKQKYMYDYR